jgi:glycosyltransferase involved in cell wall biosynthesis
LKKILILAYDFPPYISVGGLRPYAWLKYFKEFGFEPIVVTRQWDNQYGDYRDYIAPSQSNKEICEENEFGTVIRAPFHPNFSNRLLLKQGEAKNRFLRKSITALYEYGQHFLPIGTKRTIYKAARKYLEKNKVDFILATGDPFILFRYANSLSKEFVTPWIADYRDPWTLNQEEQKNKFNLWFWSYFEKKWVSNAMLITTVSTFVQEKIQRILNAEKTFLIIPNGFDPDNIEAVKQIEQNRKKLTISFVGTIYNWHPYEHFLKTCSEFLEENPDCSFHLKFYGINLTTEISDLIQTKFINLGEFVSIIPKMPNAQLLVELAKDNVMLLFNYYSYMGTKIFDYIGLKRKILFCFTDDLVAKILKAQNYHVKESTEYSGQLQAELIHDANAGILIKDATDLKKHLISLHEEFKVNNKISANTNNSDNYSRKYYVKVLADKLKQMEI